MQYITYLYAKMHNNEITLEYVTSWSQQNTYSSHQNNYEKD